jgi:hypothetical protein
MKMKIRVGKTKIMKSLEGSISSCRHCHFYRGEGRRGGNCQQLGVPVQGSWSVCPLAIPPFKPSWQNLPGIMAWQGFEPEDLSSSVLSLDIPLDLPLESELQVLQDVVVTSDNEV